MTSINFLCWNSWPLPIVLAMSGTKIHLFPSHDPFCVETRQLYLLNCSIPGEFIGLVTDYFFLLPLLAAALPGKPRVKILLGDGVKLGWMSLTAEPAHAWETWQQTTCDYFCWSPNQRLSITSASSYSTQVLETYSLFLVSGNPAIFPFFLRILKKALPMLAGKHRGLVYLTRTRTGSESVIAAICRM